VVTNTCYSFITDKDVVHVASVHQYDKDKKTLIAVPGAGGLSPTWTPLEGEYAFSWAKNIWRTRWPDGSAGRSRLEGRVAAPFAVAAPRSRGAAPRPGE